MLLDKKIRIVINIIFSLIADIYCKSLKTPFMYCLIVTIKTKESYQTIFYGNDKIL